MLYEVAITKIPTAIEAQAGAQETLILPFVQVVATSTNAALLKVGADHAEELKKAGGSADQWLVKIRQS